MNNETKHTPVKPDSIAFYVKENARFRDLIERSLFALGTVQHAPSLRTELSSALAHDAESLNPVYASAPDLLKQRDELREALKFAVATLTQPVQFSGTVTEGGCAILRGDAAAVVAKARAVLAKATDETIEVPMQGRTLAEIIATSATGKDGAK